MKLRLSVYLGPCFMAHLTELARRQKRPKSMVAEAALESLLTPDDAERREAAITRRLDQMTRQVQGLERDLNISVEALALLISLWLIVMPSLPDGAQTAAHAKARRRYHSLIKALGRRLAKGRSVLSEA